jgi:hypothetical protein
VRRRAVSLLVDVVEPVQHEENRRISISLFIKKINQEKDCLPQQILTSKETCFGRKCQCACTFMSKNVQTYPDFKVSKDCITHLFFCDVQGTVG